MSRHDLARGKRVGISHRREAEHLGVHEAGKLDRRKYEQSCSAESDPAAEVIVLTPRKVNDKITTRHDSERVNPDTVQSTIKLTTGRVITLGTAIIKLKDGRVVPLGAPPPPDKPPGLAR